MKEQTGAFLKIWSSEASASQLRRFRRKFTLLELLSVIAVILLLISLLLPSLNKARSAARKIVCLNNLKQAGVLVFQYTGENNDYFPVDLSHGESGVASSRTWPGILLGQLYTSAFCPKFDSRSIRGNWLCPELTPPGNGLFYRSNYAYTCQTSSDAATDNGAGFFYDREGGASERFVFHRITQVPGGSCLLVEKPLQKTPGSYNSSYPTQRIYYANQYMNYLGTPNFESRGDYLIGFSLHALSANFIFADGRGESRKAPGFRVDSSWRPIH